MNPVVIRNVRIGEGIPKICLPITGEREEEILKEAREMLSLPCDLVEWRADWYEDAGSLQKVGEVLQKLRIILKEKVLLFTFRTLREGGNKDIPLPAYEELNCFVARSGNADIIDAELFAGEKTLKKLISCAHENGTKVIASNHDFERTPDREEILSRLKNMEALGADILKIAVMPKTKKDVAALLMATGEITERGNAVPVVTMSMGGRGLISRLSGEFFGSAITFGSAGKASAPGQIPAEKLDEILKKLHDVVENFGEVL